MLLCVGTHRHFVKAAAGAQVQKNRFLCQHLNEEQEISGGEITAILGNLGQIRSHDLNVFLSKLC